MARRLAALCTPAACGRGRDDGVPPSRALPTPAGGLMQPATAYTSADPCPPATDPRPPSGSGCPFALEGQVDGAEGADAVLTYTRLGADRRGVPWHLQIAAAGGHAAEADVPAPGALQPLGVHGADADGAGEIFVQVDRSASAGVVGTWTLRDGRLESVTEAGRPFRFRVRGSVTHGGSGACVPVPGGAGLVVREAELAPDGAYRWTERAYRWDGGGLVAAGFRDGIVGGDAAARGRPAGFWEFRCGGLVLR